MHVFRIEHNALRFGAFRCAALEPLEPETAERVLERLGEAHRTSLWSCGNEGTNELDMQRTLAHPHNWCLLELLVPGSKVRWTMREVGGHGRIDLLALLDVGGSPTVLLLDAKKPLTGESRSKQLVGALRNSLEVLTNLQGLLPSLSSGAPPRLDLILLRGWKTDRSEPQIPKDLPSCGAGQDQWAVPEPRWCGVVPIGFEDRSDEYVLFGEWAHFSKLESVCLLAKRAFEKSIGEPKKRRGKYSMTFGYLPTGGVYVRFGFPAAEAKLAIGGELNALSAARSRQDAAGGWTFVGESNEKGRASIHWEHAAAVGESERDEALDRLRSVLGLPGMKDDNHARSHRRNPRRHRVYG